jgi:DNA-binding response OmpR family regulator
VLSVEGNTAPQAPKHRVLCVDDDRDVAEIVQAILTDEGYEVSCLYDVSGDKFQRVLGQLEPDCVLLDGSGRIDFGLGWAEAASARERRRQIPVVMFTSHLAAAAEADEGASSRAQAAGFSGVVRKPFSLDELLATVAAAVGRSEPFLRTAEAEAARTAELVAKLEQFGATDIEPSRRREWATFRSPDGHLTQLYWWQARGVYQVGRYDDEEGHLRMLGQFTDRDAAIDIAVA